MGLAEIHENGLCNSAYSRIFGFQERLLIADLAISACEFMFEETRNYVRQRKAFGKTVAHIQVSLPLQLWVCLSG